MYCNRDSFDRGRIRTASISRKISLGAIISQKFLEKALNATKCKSNFNLHDIGAECEMHDDQDVCSSD